MNEKLLFVDDEPAVLDGYRRTLYRDFHVQTADGGEQGLAMIRTDGPYAVVVSDMRMPGMTGAQFLNRVKELAPESVRMLLTGYSDINATMEAVNEGNIFRFLTKPCEKDLLCKALTAGIVQFRLMRAEKELLENTLMGSIKVLTDVLSTVSPETFGRSLRITRCTRHLVTQLGLKDPWRFEAAAMLSQLGCLTLDPEIMRSIYLGREMSAEHRALFHAHPKAARDLLMNIPRMEQIAWMIGQQLEPEPKFNMTNLADGLAEELVLGAKALKLAVAFDRLRMQGLSVQKSIERLEHRGKEFDICVVRFLHDMKLEESKMEVQKVSITRLTPGMILQQEIRTKTGILIVPKGQEVTHALLLKLANFARSKTIEEETFALVQSESCSANN